MAAKQILSVGNCYADHGAIAHTFDHHFQAQVVSVDTAAEALETLREKPFDLVLVNRVLDRDGSSGLDAIEQIRAEDDLRTIPIMLVSNYEDAQREAVARGALPGFGKAGLGQPHMLARVEKVFSTQSPSPA
jgi:two-component system chemotaxis response regulator CheY